MLHLLHYIVIFKVKAK